MTKLTTERLEYYAELPTAPAERKAIFMYEVRCMARQLLAYEQAADRPVGKIFRCSGNKTLRWWNDVPEGTVLYAAPVLPKQPELIGMKVSIDTGSDNNGHRLFGEIVGTNDSNGVPVLCIEVTENNADVTLADEEETAKIVKAAEKLVRCKGRYHSEQNYRALAALFGVTVPDLPPLPSDEAPAQPVIPEEKSAIHGTKAPEDIAFNNGFVAGWNCCRSEVISLNETTAQPVSEPYKLKDAVEDIRNSGVEIDADKIKAERDTLNSPVIPDGWKLVPIEPTENMIIEGFESEPNKTFSKPEVWQEYAAMSGCKQAAHRAKLCWAAMLAAAPTAQESE